MEPISSLDIAIKSVPLVMKAWPWLHGKLSRSYSLNSLLSTVGLESKSKDFNNLYNKALEKFEGNTHPDLFELFKSSNEVRKALETEYQGNLTEDQTLYTIRMEVNAAGLDIVKDSVEQELQAMRVFILSAIVDAMTPSEKLQYGLIHDIHDKVNEMHSWMSQQQSIVQKEELKLLQDEFDEDISDITSLIDAKHLNAAIKQLQGFKKRKWDQLLPYQKYKIMANLGLCYFELGQRDLAADCFIQLISFAETSVTFGLAALGFALKNECIEAEHYAQKALTTDPDDENAWAARLECVKDDKQFDELYSWIGSERLENHPMLAVTFGSVIKANYPERYTEGLELLKKVLPKQKANTIAWAESMELQGIMLVSIVFDADKKGKTQDKTLVEGQLRKALECLNAAWGVYQEGDLHSSKWSVLANRGSVYRRLGNNEAAVRDFMNSIHEHPHFFTFQQLIQLKMEMGEDCLPLFDEMENALQLDDHEKEQVYVGRLHYLFNKKQYKSLIENIGKKTKVYNSDVEKYISDLHIKSLLELQNYEEARHIALKSLVTFPRDPDTNFLTALVFYNLGDFPSAKKYVDIAVEVLGDKISYDCLNDLTGLLYSMNYHNQVIVLLNQPRIKSEFSLLSQRLLSSLALNGNVDEAAVIAKTLLDMEQPDPLVAQLVIESYENEGRLDDMLNLARATSTKLPHAPLFYLKALIAALGLNRIDLVKDILTKMPEQYDLPVKTLQIFSQAILVSGFNREIGATLAKEFSQNHQHIPDIDNQLKQFLEAIDD